MSVTRREFLVSSAVATATASGLSRVAYAAGSGAAEPDVIVIGAGLSGLETALTLEENGQKVLMLEGRKRIGGRVYTLFDVPGHPEVGGNSIANAYGRCIAASEKYGVGIVNLAPKLFANRDGQELFLDGEHVPLKSWATHPRNPFSAETKQLPPWAWADTVLKKHMPFKDLENWYDPKYAQYDISVHDFLAARGATDAQIHLGFDINIAYGTNSHDVSLLQQAFSDYWQNVNRGAVMGFSRTGAANGNGAGAPGAAPAGAPPAGAAAPPPGAPPGLLVGTYKGGNQNLPIAMAKRMKGDLLQGKRVVAIDVTETGAKVTCSDGTSYRAKAVVCTMPFSTLRNVAINPLPAAAQWKAIQTLGYIPITQFHIIAKKPFWEKDGMSPSMWTNGPLGMVMAQKFGEVDDRVNSLTVWCRGQNGVFIDQFGIEGGKQLIIAEFEKLRPASKGLLEVAKVHSWSTDPFSAGDWAIYQPGQVTAFRSAVAQPHQRLYFAGEHTSIGSRGMEGAFESAERVALEVLGDLG
jgi:monoamine oxidase